MKADDVTETVELALRAPAAIGRPLIRKPRLASLQTWLIILRPGAWITFVVRHSIHRYRERSSAGIKLRAIVASHSVANIQHFKKILCLHEMAQYV